MELEPWCKQEVMQAQTLTMQVRNTYVIDNDVLFSVIRKVRERELSALKQAKQALTMWYETCQQKSKEHATQQANLENEFITQSHQLIRLQREHQGMLAKLTAPYKDRLATKYDMSQVELLIQLANAEWLKQEQYFVAANARRNTCALQSETIASKSEKLTFDIECHAAASEQALVQQQALDILAQHKVEQAKKLHERFEKLVDVHDTIAQLACDLEIQDVDNVVQMEQLLLQEAMQQAQVEQIQKMLNNEPRDDGNPSSLVLLHEELEKQAQKCKQAELQCQQMAKMLRNEKMQVLTNKRSVLGTRRENAILKRKCTTQLQIAELRNKQALELKDSISLLDDKASEHAKTFKCSVIIAG